MIFNLIIFRFNKIEKKYIKCNEIKTMDFYSVVVSYFLIVFYCIARVLGFSIIVSFVITFILFQCSKMINSYFKEQMTVIREHYGLVEIEDEEVNY
jgi:hypothetical protein